MMRCARVVLVAALLVGCSSKEVTTSPSDGGAASSAQAGSSGSPDAPASSALTGTFNVSLRHAVEATMTPAFSLASGNVYDGPIPAASPLVVEREEDGCRLLTPKIPFCAEGCGADAACVEDDTCMPYPKAQNVGVVRLEGLGAEPIAMDPFPPSFAYQSMALPYPPCEEGDAVRLRVDSFGAESVCIAPLVIPGSDVISVKRDRPAELSWTPPARTDLARMQIRLDVSHHGGKKGEIDCDVADTGAFQIPASLVTALVDLGLAGFPTIILTRVASASSPEAPEVRLVVSASVERDVDTGITSCSDTKKCPAGQQCDKTNSTCQ